MPDSVAALLAGDIQPEPIKSIAAFREAIDDALAGLMINGTPASDITLAYVGPLRVLIGVRGVCKYDIGVQM